VPVFIGTFENKVDRKGRVSVPASFRQILATGGIVAFNSHRAPAIEACAPEFIDRMSARLTEMPLYSKDQDDLVTTVLSDSQPLPYGDDGRIILPERMLQHADITNVAAFVGKGPIFQIWQPEALERHKAEARARAKSQGLTLSLAPVGGGGR